MTLNALSPETPAYASQTYADSLEEFGRPLHLPAADTWILTRDISGTSHSDATGCYPLLCCHDWNHLQDDLGSLGDEIVTFTGVTNPFADVTTSQLKQTFPDLVRPYKAHLVADLTKPIDEIPSDHHQNYAQQALDAVDVRVVDDKSSFVEPWDDLYSNLRSRHNLTGLHAFSQQAFRKQLSMPEMHVIAAFLDEEPVSAHLWLAGDDLVYSHLAASSSKGYDISASYAVHWKALRWFSRQGYKYLNLGAGAGTDSDSDDGLTWFKRGWSTETRMAYLVGRVNDPLTYTKLSANHEETSYFPAYREPSGDSSSEDE